MFEEYIPLRTTKHQFKELSRIQKKEKTSQAWLVRYLVAFALDHIDLVDLRAKKLADGNSAPRKARA